MICAEIFELINKFALINSSAFSHHVFLSFVIVYISGTSSFVAVLNYTLCFIWHKKIIIDSDLDGVETIFMNLIMLNLV
jgi:hypothetical protein